MADRPTYERLRPAAKALLAELEAERREYLGNRSDALRVERADARLLAADYVIRAVTGDVLADDEVRLCMEHAFEEVG